MIIIKQVVEIWAQEGNIRHFLTRWEGKQVGKIWRMISRMHWIKQEYEYPVLFDSETVAVKDEDKAEMLTETYAKIHSSDNISNEGRKERNFHSRG